MGMRSDEMAGAAQRRVPIQLGGTKMIHIYCGDGKGKTTAALGLAVRAAGRGKKVLIARFLKTDDSGEVPALALIPQIRMIPCEKNFGFFFRMSREQKKEAEGYYSGLLEQVIRQSKEFDMVILDEIMAACNYGLAPEDRLVSWLSETDGDSQIEKKEIILTGREPSEIITGMADYITEMKKLRHPYDKGIQAREGIEY